MLCSTCSLRLQLASVVVVFEGEETTVLGYHEPLTAALVLSGYG